MDIEKGPFTTLPDGQVLDEKGEVVLWAADPECSHEIVAKGITGGGGVHCLHCEGWMCY